MFPNLSNPMMPLNAPTDQSMALMQLMSLLGGLGNAPTAAKPMSPTLAAPAQPQPAAGIQPLLGGLQSPFTQNPMKPQPKPYG